MRHGGCGRIPKRCCEQLPPLVPALLAFGGSTAEEHWERSLVAQLRRLWLGPRLHHCCRRPLCRRPLSVACRAGSVCIAVDSCPGVSCQPNNSKKGPGDLGDGSAAGCEPVGEEGCLSSVTGGVAGS